MTAWKKYLIVAVVAAAGLLFDQATKFLVLGFLAENQTIPVIPGFFDLTLRFNTGAAFSLFSSKPALFFYIVSAVAIGALFYFIRLLEDGQWTQMLALGAVLGGAAGNLTDRLRLGSVVDFLLFYRGSWSWPAFNAADAFIVVGVFVFLWYNLRQSAGPVRKAD